MDGGRIPRSQPSLKHKIDLTFTSSVLALLIALLCINPVEYDFVFAHGIILCCARNAGSLFFSHSFVANVSFQSRMLDSRSALLLV